MLDLRRTVLCDAGRSVADLSISPSGHSVAVCFGNDDQTGTPVAIYDSATGRLSHRSGEAGKPGRAACFANDELWTIQMVEHQWELRVVDVGSGYKSSCNLITTSAQYNQGDMAKAETRIPNWLNDVSEELDEDQWVLTDFTLELDVEWGAFDDARGVQAMCDVLGITEPDILAEAQGIVSTWFTNHPALSKNLQRVMRIDYKVTAHNTSPDYEPSMKTFTGVDGWLAIT